MSGRKRGEVELVLRGSGNAGQVRMAGHLRRCDDALGDIAQLVAQGALDPTGALESSQPKPGDIRGLDAERSAIEQERQAWRDETEALERQMRARENDTDLRDQWYYDAEYSSARVLDSRFARLEGRVQQLRQRAEAMRGQLRAAVHARQEREEQERLQAVAAVADLERKMGSVTLPHPLQPERSLDLAGCANELIEEPQAYFELASGLERLRSLLSAGQHAEVITLHRQLDQDGDALIETLNCEYEALRKMTGTALEIAETLSEMGYRVDSETLGQGLREGLKVFTVGTDRGVEFDVVAGAESAEETQDDVQKRVQVRFNVDGLGHQCGHSAEDIQRRLRHRGVDLMITDWGRSPPQGDPSTLRGKERSRETQ